MPVKPDIQPFENIAPWGTTGGDTGLSSRMKLQRNFERIKAWIDALELGMDETAVTALITRVGQQLFLSKTGDDTAAGKLTFQDILTLLSGAVFSDTVESAGASAGMDDGTGIILDADDGTIEADGLTVRGWMVVRKLLYNYLQIMEQDYQFSGGGDIEQVVNNGDGTYTLHIHKEKEGRHTSFSDFDILYGKVDELQQDGTYYTSWMRVTENGVTLNDGMTPDTVRVELWVDNMVPGGRNFAPKAMMTVARRGNTLDENRQGFWELSTTDQRIAYYWHVDQPILRADNYALCLGILPTILDNAGVLPSTRDRSMPGLYVNTIFYENAHHIYYPSRIVKEDRGEWTASPTVVYTGPTGVLDSDTYTQGVTVIGEPYHHEAFTRNMWLTYRLNPAYASLSDAQLRQKMEVEWHVDKETSRVWRYGALWECLVEGTAEEPGLSGDWALISGLGIRVDFAFDRGTVVWCDDVKLRAEARIMIGNADITDDLTYRQQNGGLDLTWIWERMGNADDTQTAADQLWQPTAEAGHPNVLLIDHRLDDPSRRQDCGPLWESLLRVCFRCTVRLSTGVMADGEFGIA